jgi:cytoplasmic iron level regulating protein YaaA (DUF328/UPF0246 family)
MLCLLSPAKTFDASPFDTTIAMQAPFFAEKTKVLMMHMQKMTPEDIGGLMHVSEKLADLNFGRYQGWDKAESVPALHLYHGDVNKGLKHEPLSLKNWQYADEHIAFLSGLYGVVGPLDGIKPHRLEMGTKLKTANGKNLYEFWGEEVTQRINTLAKEAGAEAIVNLASKEYSRVVVQKKLKTPMIDVMFLDFSGGKYKTVAIYAKRARGLFARFVLENQIKKRAELCAFCDEGYMFSVEKSDENTLVFVREKK